VNGVVVRELGAKADPLNDLVAVDGQPVVVERRRITIAFHKPRSVMTTMSDPEGRPTIAPYLAGVGARVYPVGRLDFNTTGLLLCTNDGELAARLMHPRYGVPRVYRAKVDGTPDQAAIDRLRRGVRLDDGKKTAPARVRVLERLPTKTWLEITVHEGRWRMVRRMCAAVGHSAEKLERVALGPIALGTLRPGEWRALSPRELATLARSVGLRRGGGGPAAARPARPAPRTPPRRSRPRPGR
jgi:pseudouridine synthase